MNYFGLLMGLASLVVIGLGFVWVILSERYLGYLWWLYFFGSGCFFLVISLWIVNDWASALSGAVGASLIWGSTELKNQAIRAKLGWFPNHPHKIHPPFYRVIARLRPPGL